MAKLWARLQRYGASLEAFRRGIDLSEQTGNIKQAADAALAAFREIGEHLSVSDSEQLISGREWGKDKHAWSKINQARSGASRR